MKFSTLIILASAVLASEVPTAIGQYASPSLPQFTNVPVINNRHLEPAPNAMPDRVRVINRYEENDTPDKKDKDPFLNWIYSNDGVRCSTFKNKEIKDIPEECIRSVLCIEEPAPAYQKCPPASLSFDKSELVKWPLKRECFSQILCALEREEEKPFVAPTVIPEISNFRGFWDDDE